MHCYHHAFSFLCPHAPLLSWLLSYLFSFLSLREISASVALKSKHSKDESTRCVFTFPYVCNLLFVPPKWSLKVYHRSQAWSLHRSFAVTIWIALWQTDYQFTAHTKPAHQQIKVQLCNDKHTQRKYSWLLLNIISFPPSSSLKLYWVWKKIENVSD